MCNLYRLRTTREEVAAYFKANDDWRRDVELDKDYVAPGKRGMVVREQDGQRVLSGMLWGYPTFRPRKRPAKEGQPAMLTDWWTNARHLEKSMWKASVSAPAQRCLVPFTQFAEPKAVADRADPRDDKWWFDVTDQSLPCFAGVWNEDKTHGRVFAFCTTEPNPLVKPKHPNAMPVILLAEDHDRWLRGSYDDALELQAAYPSQLMSIEGV